MVVPTTVLPPAVDELDIQALANVPMPVVQVHRHDYLHTHEQLCPEFLQQRVEVALVYLAHSRVCWVLHQLVRQQTMVH
ncbi:MAG: hypothetical protein CM15mV111_080 [uncultured marine virus]|nr:MAG: hypothetical protein CM15mV111_080 [uncultured marine virus]